MLRTFDGFKGELNRLKKYLKEHPDEYPPLNPGQKYFVEHLDSNGNVVKKTKGRITVGDGPLQIMVLPDGAENTILCWPIK